MAADIVHMNPDDPSFDVSASYADAVAEIIRLRAERDAARDDCEIWRAAALRNEDERAALRDLATELVSALTLASYFPNTMDSETRATVERALNRAKGVL